MPYAKHSLTAKLRAGSPTEPIQFKAAPFHYAVSDRVLLADLNKVARRMNARSLFQQQYNKHGRFCAATYRQRFGSWNAALEAARLLPSAPRFVEDRDILGDIRAVADRLGVKKLPREVYFREGRYSTTNIARRFGAWTGAVKAAGLTANPPPPRGPSRQELFDNLEQLWRSLARQPIGRDIDPPRSRFSLRAYRSEFGTFRKALTSFIAHMQQIGKTSASGPPIMIPPRHKTRREVRAVLRYQVLCRDQFKCRLCGRSPATDPAIKLHIDHIKPWSAGGETTQENLQTLCETCNAGKAASVFPSGRAHLLRTTIYLRNSALKTDPRQA